MVEQWSVKSFAVGSNPTPGANKLPFLCKLLGHKLTYHICYYNGRYIEPYNGKEFVQFECVRCKTIVNYYNFSWWNAKCKEKVMTNKETINKCPKCNSHNIKTTTYKACKVLPKETNGICFSCFCGWKVIHGKDKQSIIDL